MLHGVAQAREDQDERVEARIHARRVDAEGGVGRLLGEVEDDAGGAHRRGRLQLLEGRPVLQSGALGHGVDLGARHRVRGRM